MENIISSDSNPVKTETSTYTAPYTWPAFPFAPSSPIEPVAPINPLDTGANITYFAPSPSILALEVKDKVLFYYMKDSAIYYAIYEKGKPIVFTLAYDLSEIFKILGAL